MRKARLNAPLPSRLAAAFATVLRRRPWAGFSFSLSPDFSLDDLDLTREEVERDLIDLFERCDA